MAGAQAGSAGPFRPALVLALLALAACGRNAPDFDRCRQAHADMLYTEAERCYAMLVDRDPDAWQPRYHRALIRADRGGGTALVDDLQRVTELQPSFSPAWLRLGDAEFKAGRYDAAAAAWQRVLELPEPSRTQRGAEHIVEVPAAGYATLGLARIALARGDVERARMLLEPLTAAEPEFSPALRALAEVHTRAGRRADAERATYRAGRLPPFAPYADPILDELAHISRNATFLLRLSSDASLATNAAWSEYLVRRALEVEPDNPDAVAKLARLLRAAGRAEEALTYFRRYHEMVPGDFEGVAQIGATLSDLGRYGEAEPYLRRALTSLDDATTHYNLGLLLASQGKLDEAAAEYRAALQREPGNSNARINLATVLARSNRHREAAAELERVVRDDPENPLAHANLGIVLAGLGHTERATRFLREALRLDPDLAPAQTALDAITAR